MDTVETLVVGAGPAGLRAAQVLAESDREVLVVERQAVVGPKVCAGGLSAKAVRELSALGLPRNLGVTSLAEVSFRGEPAVQVDPVHGWIRTVARARLGVLQAAWASTAGADLITGAEVADFDLTSRRVRVNSRPIRYRHLIGADGSSSRVRRALGLPTPRAYFAAEFNVGGAYAASLSVLCDSLRLASGYSWVFPHCDYTSFGAGAPTALIRPSALRRYLEVRMAALGMPVHPADFEAATIEVRFLGFHFPNGLHLVGDAAGVASGLTGEGIYAALITGEEVARQILDPAYPAPKSRTWLRHKRLHDAIGRAWFASPVRNASFALLRAALRTSWSRAWTTVFFLDA